MLITISLMSREEGEIEKLLYKCYDKKSHADSDVIEWMYVYQNAVEAITFMDNVMSYQDKYDVSIWIKINDEDMVEVTQKTHPEITKSIISDWNNEGSF